MRFEHQGHGGGALAESAALSFAIFVVGMATGLIIVAILDQMDIVGRGLPAILVSGVVLVVLFAAIAGRTDRLAVFLVDARNVGPGITGAATAAAALPATLLLSETGALHARGFDGLPVVIGSVGGFMLVAMMLAPFVRKSGAVTVADFLALRFGDATGVLAALVSVAVGLQLLTLQLSAFGTLGAAVAGIPHEAAVLGGAGLTLLVVMLGGMRAVTWTQALLYLVLATTIVLTAVLLGWRVNGHLFPPLAMGAALREIGDLEFALLAKKLADGASLKRYAVPYLTSDALNAAGIGIGMMLGMAAMPHVLGRSLAARSPHEARSGAAWAMFLVLLAALMLPALAAFGKLELLRQLATGRALGDLPSWMVEAGRLGMVKVCGVAAADADAVAAACRSVGGNKGLLRLQDVRVEPETFLLALSAMTGLPRMLAALLAAAIAAAALAASVGLALALAATLSHDVLHRLVDRSAPDRRRLLMARVAALAAVGAATFAAFRHPGAAAAVAAWVFPIAAVVLLPVLVLGVWMRRANGWGAAAGMISGGAVVLYYLAATRFAPVAFFETWFGYSNAGMSAVMKYQSLKAALANAPPAAAAAAEAALTAQAREIANVWGLKPAAAALLGLPVAFVVAILVSLATPRPDAGCLSRLDAIRRPHRREAEDDGDERSSTAS